MPKPGTTAAPIKTGATRAHPGDDDSDDEKEKVSAGA